MDFRAVIQWDAREPPPRGYQRALAGARHLQHDHRFQHRDNQFHQPPAQHPQYNLEENEIPKPQPSTLLPLSVSLTAQVVEDTAKVTVTQLFWNDTNTDIWKGSYTFPLSAGCTVTAFSCRIGTNKIVRAKIKAKLEARDAFNEAVRNNRSAGLLEQDTPEIFTTTLGNIPAHTKLKTEITYVTLLKHRFADNCSTTTLTIPTYIASRYGSPPPELRNTEIPGLSRGLSIQIEVVAAEAVPKISSKTHKITIERGVGRNLYGNWAEFAATPGANGGQMALVKLKDGLAFLDRDFVLEISTQLQDGLESPTAWLETHPSLENHKAVMLTIPPNFMLRNQSPSHDGEIIFLADRSGSMVDKMNSLKSAMNFFLKGIPQGRKFNIWCFGSHYTSMWQNSLAYSEETLQEAMDYVSRQFTADMGGTELLSALEATVAATNSYHTADIVILTDGEVWGLNQTINFVQDTSRSTKGRTRFFALGIGNTVSHALVEGIAKAGGGYAEVVPAASQGGWEDRVVAMLVAALTGHIGSIKVQINEHTDAHAPGRHLLEGHWDPTAAFPTRPNFLQSPADISTLSPFLRNRAFMLFDSSTEQPSLDYIFIKVTTPRGQEIVTRVPVQLVERKASTLHKLGARALLGDLERGESWIHLDPNAPPRGSTQETTIVRREAESLGYKWSLVSKWTSFYADEEPYRAEGNARIPFLDGEDLHIHEAVGDLDLLRPRGVAGQHVQPPILPRPVDAVAQEDAESEEDDDTASDPDPSVRSHDDDSDSEDGGNDGDGRGAGGNQMSGSGGDQQAPEPRDDNSGGNGGDTSGDPLNGQGGNSHLGPAAPTNFSLSAASLSIGGGSESPISIPDTAHTVTYASPLLPPSALDSDPWSQASMQFSGPLASDTDIGHHKKAAGRPFNRMLSRLGRTVPNTRSDSKSDPKLSSKTDNKLDRKSRYVDSGYTTVGTDDSTVRTLSSLYSRPPLPSFRQDVKTADSKSLRSAPSYASPSSSPDLTPSSGDLVPEEMDLLYTKPLDRPSNLTSNVPISQSGHPLQFDVRSQFHSSLPAFFDVTHIDPPILSETHAARADSAQRVPTHNSSSISVPTFNLPASTAMLSIQSQAPKSAQEKDGEQQIRSLLVFQSYNGSFRFNNMAHLRSYLGIGFESAVMLLQGRTQSGVIVDFSLATTLAIMALFEEKFQFCKDLWELVYQKARTYVYQNLSVELERAALYQSARDQIRILDVSMLHLETSAYPLGSDGTHPQDSVQLSNPTTTSDQRKTSWGTRKTKKGKNLGDFLSKWTSEPLDRKGIQDKRVVLETAPAEE